MSRPWSHGEKRTDERSIQESTLDFALSLHADTKLAPVCLVFARFGVRAFGGTEAHLRSPLCRREDHVEGRSLTFLDVELKPASILGHDPLRN